MRRWLAARAGSRPASRSAWRSKRLPRAMPKCWSRWRWISAGTTTRRCRSPWPRSRATPIRGNSEAAILLALLLDDDGRPDDALAMLSAVGAGRPARRRGAGRRGADAGDKGDLAGRWRRARAAAAAPSAGPQDYAPAGQCAGRHGPPRRSRRRLWRGDRASPKRRRIGQLVDTVSAARQPASSRPTAGPRPRPSWKRR